MHAGRIAHPRLRIETLQAQRKQLRLQFALLFLERLIATRGGRLALQMADLLLDLLAQIIQAIEVLARLGDAALGLAAALLVARNARRLLEERAQIIRACLDDARNHALLDDGVAARAQSRAEEQLRDVLAPHLGAVDEVIRRAVAAHRAAQSHLVVARIGAADLSLRIIENELDRAAAQGLARHGSVEDDVGHGLAAQMLGGNLAHHPTHGVDDVRFTAAVRAYDAREARGKGDGGGIDE